LRARLRPDVQPPRAGERAWFSVLGPHTCFYNAKEELIA
jgi:hypothetical protein